MSISRFVLLTGLGAGIWASILSLLGYLIGDNQELVQRSLHNVTIYTAIFIAVLLLGYVGWYRRRKES